MKKKDQDTIKKVVFVAIAVVIVILLMKGCQKTGGGTTGGGSIGGGPSGGSSTQEPCINCSPIWFDRHWECYGKCINTDERCVMIPSEEYYEYLKYSWNNPLECTCLKPSPGECNWYDASYGEGSDNIQCGGSCPTGYRCKSRSSGSISYCNCELEEQTTPCESIQPRTESDCNVGYCESGTVQRRCTYVPGYTGYPSRCECQTSYL